MVSSHGIIFFFSSRRRHTRWPRDWSSDVCSSDLTCKGARLRPEVLAVTVGGRSIAEVTDMSIRDALTFHQELELGEREAAIADEVLREIRSRLEIGRASCRERETLSDGLVRS